MHAPEKFARVGGEKEATAGNQRIVNALQKAPSPFVGACAKIITGRVREQIISRAQGLRQQERKHHVKITADKPDIFQAAFDRFCNSAKERLLGKIDAEYVDMRILHRPAARKRSGAAAEVDLKRPIVAEKFLRGQNRKRMHLSV
jgi:predicted oxidoreductase